MVADGDKTMTQRQKRATRRKIVREEAKVNSYASQVDIASDLAVSMVLGEYEFPEGCKHVAAPGSWTWAAVIVAMGYAYTRDKPDWWPQGGRFNRIVAAKLVIRKMQANIDFSIQNAWAGPMLGMAVEEMMHRLARNPDKVSDRDLTDLITKMTRMFVDKQKEEGPKGGTTINNFTFIDKMPQALKDRLAIDAQAASDAVMAKITAKATA